MGKTKLKGVAALIAAAVAVILAAFLCMSFPMAEVHAAEYDVSDGPSLVCRMAEAQEGDIIRLQDSITIDLTDEATVQSMYGGRVEANKDLYLSADTTYPAHSQTLDLNGKTLTIITGSDKSCFTLEGAITLTIIDSSAERTGAIVGHSNGSLFYSETAESSLVLQDVAVQFTEYTEGGASITPAGAVIDTVGNVTLNNVTYTPAEGGPALIEDNAGAQVSYIADKAEELAAAVADSSYSTVMLGADITQNITVEAGRTLTLDLNGYTLTAAAVDEKAVVSNYGTLTIVNTDTANTGAIQSADGSTWYTVFNEGTMTIGAEDEGYGELEVKNNSASNPASLVENNHDCSAEDPATLTIISGTFTASGACLNAVKNDGYGICTIYGGTFTNEAEGGAAVMSAGTMTIYDGTFVQKYVPTVQTTANAVRNASDDEKIVITGGTFTGNLLNDDAAGFAISGGRFDRTFNAEFLAEDAALYMPESGEGYVAVSTEPIEGMNKVVVYSGGVGYTSLQAAINADGTEVGLASDITESVTVPSAVDIRIRMNGYTLTAENDSDPVITVEGALTWVNVAGEVVSNVGVLVKDGGSITIEAAPVITFTGATNLTVEAGGSASVANGIFNGAIINNGGTIELSGGTYANKPESDWLAGGYGAIVNENGAYDVAQLTAQITYTSDGQQVIEGFADWQTTLTRFKELRGQEGEIILTIIRVIFFESDADILTVESGMNVTLVMDKPFYPSIVNSGNLTICTNGFSGNYIAGRQVGSITNRENGTLAIEGGKFNGAIINENTAPGSVVVSGGTFMSGDLLRSILPYIADGYCVTTLTSASSGATINQAKALVEVKDSAYTLQFSSLAAANTYARYLAVEKAVTLTLLDDVAVNTVTFGGSSTSAATAWTIDLGGNTLTCEAASSYSTYATFTFGSNGYPVTYTVQGGTLLFTKGNNSRYAVTVNYGSTLILNDVNIEFASETPFADMINVAGGSTLNIESGNYYGGITRTNGTITIAEGCVFEEDIKDVLGDGLTQNESGMVVKDGAENAVAMIETETGIVYYDTLQAAINAAESGATVTLLKDLTESVTVAEGQEIVLDLNGCTLTNSGTDTIVNNGTLTVTGNGTVDNTVHQGAALQNNGKATLENGTFTRSKEAGKDDNANGNSWYVIDNSGTLTLKDVTVYQGTDEVNALQWTFSSTIRNKGASAEQMAVMEVDGAKIVSGKIALKNDDWGKMTIEDVTVTGGNQAVQNWADLTINGGTFTGDVATWFYAIQGSEPETRTHATITGGAFNGGVVCFDYDQDPNGGVEIDQGVTISGDASFKNMPRYTYFAEGSAAAWDEGSQMYVTAAGEYVAAIEGFGYTSLQAAIDAAKDCDTVTLLDDIEFESGSAVKAPSLGIALTIDLNGHRITSADGYSAVFDITTTKSFTLTSSKEGAAIEAAYALRLRGSGTGEVAIAVENIAFSGAYVFNSPLTFGRSNTAQVSVTLRNVRAEYTDNLKNMQSFLLNADRLASLQVTGSTFTVSSKNAEKAQGAYAVNLIATEAAFTDSTIEAKGTLARGIYSHNSGTVISALTLNNTAVTAEDIAIESSYADLTVNGGTVTSNASAAVLFFGHMTPEAAAAAIDTQEGYQTLTVTGGAQISGYTFGIGGNAEGTYDGTVMNIEDAVITGGEEAPGVFQPHVGILNIGGENTKIIGSSGVVVRAGRLNIAGGTFTATYATLHTVEGSGSVIDGAAVAVSHHSSNQPLTVSITGGTFNGVYSVYEDTLLSGPDPAKVSVSLAGGVYNGGVYSENKVGFITGGSFKQQPAEELFNENYAAEYQNGYYVAVRSDALKTARANAQADVRNYAAANGISWLALEDEAATVGTETPVYTAQQAADILAAFNAIDSAMTQLAVAEARLAAMNMVDAYVEALDTYKLDMIGDLQTAAADDEETADVDESVVLPTATYSAIYNATSASEIDFYVENALAEIEAIRSLRTEISGQTQQLADLADALEAMSDGLFGDTESGTQGAFAELLGDVQGAIKQAQNAIVNGEEGSTSLSSLQESLTNTINQALKEIKDALTNTETELEAIKKAIDDFNVSEELAGDFDEVLGAITAAQDAITGSTGGEGGTSIGDAITQINDNTATLVDDLREALIGENGTLTQVAAAVQGLTDLNIGGEFDGVLTAITNAQNAIMGVTEEDADGVNLSEVLGAVGSVNTAVTDALATMNGTLAEWQQTVADYAETLADIETALGDGEGSLYDRISTAIIAAQDAIMGSTGGEGGTSIGAAVSDLKTELSVVQQAIIDAMPNYSDQLTTISRNIEALQTLLNGNNGLAAIKKELDGVVSAIGSATSGDTSASGLFALLEAIQSGNSTIESAVTAVQNALLGTNNNGALAAISGALEEAQNDLGSLTGALLEANGGLATDITDALAAIDAITTAIGSLGTDNEELAAQIGSVVDSLESVQGAVDEIGSNLGVAVDIEETKTNAVADLEVWLNAYLDTLLGTTTDEAESGVVMLAVTLETEDGDLYGRLTQAYSEANAQLILKYYNQALTAIDNATSTTDVSTAVSTFRAQVASVDAAAQNTPSMTGVYVLLAIVLVVLIAASIVVILKNRKAAAAVAAQPAAEAAAEEKPAEEAKPEAAEEAAEAESEEADKAEEELAADDDDKEQVVIAANVRSFAEAYVELSDEQRELFNKVKEYALGKEGTSEVKLSSGDCVKLGSKQVVKLAVRRGNPVALFVLENEMLKDFRRGATTQAKLKVRATELVLREEADLETAYTMVDLSIDQIKKDAAAAKERRREQRRERRKQRLAEEAARQAEHDGSED